MAKNIKLPASKILVAGFITLIALGTLYMHWETIKEKLMPDYGTDPYVLGQSCKPKKN